MESFKIIPIVLFFLIAGIVFFSFYNPTPKFEFSEKGASMVGNNENNCTIMLNFTLSNFDVTAENVTVVATMYGADKETITNEYINIGKMRDGDVKKYKKSFVVFSNCRLIKGVDLNISSYETGGITKILSKN